MYVLRVLRGQSEIFAFEVVGDIGAAFALGRILTAGSSMRYEVQASHIHGPRSATLGRVWWE